MTDRLAEFPVHCDNIKILDSPTEFRNEISNLILGSRSEISIACLYVGDESIITELKQQMQRKPDLKVRLMVDYFRGTRPKSTFGLVQRIEPSKERFKTSFYRSPLISKLQELIVPLRFIEAFSLLHTKIYVFDETVILTGANLAHDYFTSRQDRYMVVKDARFAQCIKSIFNVLDASAFELKEGVLVEPKGYRTKEWIESQRLQLTKILNNSIMKDQAKDCEILVPFIQSKMLDIHNESRILRGLIQKAISRGYDVDIATAYFNIPLSIQKYLAQIGKSKSKLEIMVSSPSANSFYNSQGISKYVPILYDNLLLAFLKAAPNAKILEYIKPNHTWHSKGIWIKDFKNPATIIGSSNFNYRSLERDLELSVLVKSTSAKGGEMILSDLKRLKRDCQEVSEAQVKQRRGGIWLRFAARMLRSML